MIMCQAHLIMTLLLETNYECASENDNDLMKKVFFRCNSPCFAHLLLFFTGKTNIQKI